MLERFQTMSPDEQKQFIARMKERGVDVSALEKAAPAKVSVAPKGDVGQTIDALFAPLPTVESRGRVWLYINKELKPVNLRLGITDGTNTELLSEEIQPGTEVVTGVITGTARPAAGGQNSGNPLLPNQGRRGGDFGGFQGGGGGRGR